MKTKILDLIDFEKVNTLLEGFNKSTGFVTAILDLDGNVLSKSGWRQICTEFHRVNPETSKKCNVSDTELAGKLAAGEKYHFYKCLNGLVDVAVPIVIKGEHIANLFSGQFFFEEPNRPFFEKQAQKYGFNDTIYLKALGDVPVVSQEKVKTAMDFLLDMTQMISEMTFQKLEQTVLNEDLQNSKEYNRSLFAESPIGLLLTAINGKLIDANPAFCKIIGRTLEETLNLTYWDITPEKYSLQEAEQLKSLETKGNYGPYEKEYIHKDGYLVSVRLQGNIMERKGQKYIWSSVEDITERKNGEIRLRDEKEQKRIILELVGDPIFLKDNDHRIIFANQAFFDLFGLNEKSVIGKTLAENVPKNERKHFLEIDRNVLDTGIPDYREEELTVGKQTSTIITRKTRFIDESGNRFLVGSIHNITERKMAEDRLKKSEHNLSEAERIGNTGSWEYDVASDTSSWSENMFHIFDVDQEMPTELVFKHFVENLVHPDDRQNVLFVFQDALSGKRPYNLEYRTIKSDGSLRIIHAIAETIRDENGKVIRMIGKVEDITERKLAEVELKKSEERFRTLFEHAPDGFFVADTNGYYVDVNTSGAQMLGYKRDEIIGLHLFDIVQPQVTSLVDKDYKEVKAGKQYHSEWEFKRKDGSILQGDLIGATLPDGNVLGIVRDITERKKAEEALREREEKFESIFETANAGKSITLPTGEMDANEAFCKMLGYTREELKYKRWQEITPEEEIPTIEKILEPLLKGEKDSVRFEKRYICKNETLIWADISIAIRCDENGKPLYLITTIIDITERKLAERALHESNERLKLIFENTPIAMWDWDLNSDRWFATPKYYTMLGYEPEDGYPDRTVWLKRIHPDDRESVAKKITNIMNRSKKDYSYDARMLHADGTYRWQIVIGHVIEYDENQNAQRMIGVRIDINERKKAEEEISKLNRELEQRVKERTEELEAANKDLEEINDLFIGRESRIIELKEELEKLKSKSHLG